MIFQQHKPKLFFKGGKRGWVGDNPFIYLDTKKILADPTGVAKIIYFMCSDEASLLKGSIRTA